MCKQAIVEVAWILNVIKEISQVGEMAQKEIKGLREKLEQEKIKTLASDLIIKLCKGEKKVEASACHFLLLGDPGKKDS